MLKQERVFLPHHLGLAGLSCLNETGKRRRTGDTAWWLVGLTEWVSEAPSGKNSGTTLTSLPSERINPYSSVGWDKSCVKCWWRSGACVPVRGEVYIARTVGTVPKGTCVAPCCVASASKPIVLASTEPCCQ